MMPAAVISAIGETPMLTLTDAETAERKAITLIEGTTTAMIGLETETETETDMGIEMVDLEIDTGIDIPVTETDMVWTDLGETATETIDTEEINT